VVEPPAEDALEVLIVVEDPAEAVDVLPEPPA
jgi:hypothetical protein